MRGAFNRAKGASLLKQEAADLFRTRDRELDVLQASFLPDRNLDMYNVASTRKRMKELQRVPWTQSPLPTPRMRPFHL